MLKVSMIIMLFWALVGVQCAPGILLGSTHLPVGDTIGTGGSSLGIDAGLSADGGVELSEHQESKSERSEHNEQHNKTSNETSYCNGTSSQQSLDQSESNKVHDSHETRTNSETRGIKLGGPGGFSAYDNKKQMRDRTTSDQESGKTSSIRKERTANSKHDEVSGSEYKKNAKTQDHEETSQNQRFSLGGLGGGSSITNESGATKTHDASQQESGSSWKQTQDKSRDGHQTRVATSNQAAQYANASKDSSATSTHKEETKTNGPLDQGNQGTDQVQSVQRFGQANILQYLNEDGYPTNDQLRSARQINTGATSSTVSQDYLQTLRERIISGSWHHQAGNIAQAGNVAPLRHISTAPGSVSSVLGSVSNVLRSLSNIPGYISSPGYANAAQASADHIGSHYANLLAISSMYEKPSGMQIDPQQQQTSLILPGVVRPYDSAGLNWKQRENSQIVKPQARNLGYDRHSGSLRRYSTQGTAFDSHLARPGNDHQRQHITGIQKPQNDNQHEQNSHEGYTRLDGIENSKTQYTEAGNKNERLHNGQNTKTDGLYTLGYPNDKRKNANSNERGGSYVGHVNNGVQVIQNKGGVSSNPKTLTSELLAAIKNGEDVVKELEEGKFGRLHQKVVIIPGGQVNTNGVVDKYGGKHIGGFNNNGWTDKDQRKENEVKDGANNGYVITRSDIIKDNGTDSKNISREGTDSKPKRFRSYDNYGSGGIKNDTKQNSKSIDDYYSSKSPENSGVHNDYKFIKRYHGYQGLLKERNNVKSYRDSAESDSNRIEASRFGRDDEDRDDKNVRDNIDYKPKHLTKESSITDKTKDEDEPDDEENRDEKNGRDNTDYKQKYSSVFHVFGIVRASQASLRSTF